MYLLKLSDGDLYRLTKFIEDEKDVKDGESTAVDLEMIRFFGVPDGSISEVEYIHSFVES